MAVGVLLFLVFNGLVSRRLGRLFLNGMTLLLVEGLLRLGGLHLYVYFGSSRRKEIEDVLKMKSC